MNNETAMTDIPRSFAERTDQNVVMGTWAG